MGSHLRGLGSQSSEVCGLRECHQCCFPDLLPHPWIGCGAQGPPHIAENESPAPVVPEEEDTLPKARGEGRQENDPSHHVLQHGHLEKRGLESISPTHAGIKQAPS